MASETFFRKCTGADCSKSSKIFFKKKHFWAICSAADHNQLELTKTWKCGVLKKLIQGSVKITILS